MKQCPHCAELLDESARSCPKCTERIQVSPKNDERGTNASSVGDERSASPSRRGLRLELASLAAILLGVGIGSLFVGACVSAFSTGMMKASWSTEERVVYELCRETPDCRLPIMNGPGYLTMVVLVVSGLWLTRKWWSRND